MSAAEAGPSARQPPLVVDVDGSLLMTDPVYETALQLIARKPILAPAVVGWLSKGRKALERELARRIEPHVATLPLRSEVLAVVREAQESGREVYLTSQSERGLLEPLAERVGGIAGVFARDHGPGGKVLPGATREERLVGMFGEKGFDYIGDNRNDFAVWNHARHALAVCHSRAFENEVRRRFPDVRVISVTGVARWQYLKAMRPHQWVKNVLVFLPILAGHHFDSASIGAAFLAFVCFCLAASSAYLLNDLLDLPADRQHPSKQERPFASGRVPISHGIVQCSLLAGSAALLSLLLPAGFQLLLLLYVVVTLTYSFYLKRKLFIDVITLGGLYTIRVLAGVEASGVVMSEWLLIVSLFLFMSLATVKRCDELVRQQSAGAKRTIGRGYRVVDLPVIVALAAAAGYGTSLVLALYISSGEVAELYTHPQRLWLVQPLFLYWISRILIVAHRGELHSDPVIYAGTDRTSLLTGACVLGVVLISL